MTNTKTECQSHAAIYDLRFEIFDFVLPTPVISTRVE